MSWPHSVFPLVSNGSLLHTYCVPTTFPPSYPPLFISPSPLYTSVGHGDELLTRATIRSEGFLLQRNHYVYAIPCVYLLSRGEPSNSTARCLQFQWNLSTRVEQDVTKIPSLFPRINIRELYPLRWNFWINNLVRVVSATRRCSRCSAFQGDGALWYKAWTFEFANFTNFPRIRFALRTLRCGICLINVAWFVDIMGVLCRFSIKARYFYFQLENDFAEMFNRDVNVKNIYFIIFYINFQ